MLKSLTSVPQNVTLFANKIVADIIKLGGVHIGVGRSNPMWLVSLKQGEIWR